MKATEVASLLRRIAAPLAAALLVAGLAGTPAVAAPAPPRTASGHAVLVEAGTGAVLWERNAHRPTLVASTTKVLTALVAQETWPPAKIITVPVAAERVDGTRLGYQTGMRVRRRDLVASLMQISANDAAETLAAAHPAGRAGFIRAMQAKADALGCTDSTWRDPSGLDAPGHKASAADLAVLGRALLAVPELAALVRQPSIHYRWPDGRVQVIAGHNRFVSDGEDRGALGIKTGFTDAAQHTIVAAQRRGGRTLIAVALGAPSAARDREDVRAMFRFGFATTAKAGAEILGATAADSVPGSATAPSASPPPAAAPGGAAAQATTPRGGLFRWLQGGLLVAPLPLAVLVAAVLLLVGAMTVRSSERAARRRGRARAPVDQEPPDPASRHAYTVTPRPGSLRNRGGGR
jgi:D-alanyl-D-alanine carboxypeptidase (penicillin-binding protein 5/6)